MSNWVSDWFRGGQNSANEDGNQPSAAATNASSGEALDAEAARASAEEIRRKRLERLTQQAAVPTPSAPPAASSTDTPADTSTLTPAPMEMDHPEPPKHQPTSLAAQPVVQAAVAVSTTTTATAPVKAVAAPAPPVTKKKPLTDEQKFVLFLNELLERLMNVTLNKKKQSRYFVLEEMIQENDATTDADEEDGGRANWGNNMLNAGNFSEALYLRVTKDPVQLSSAPSSEPLAALEYLEQCYYRCREESRGITSASGGLMARFTQQQRQEVEESVSSLREMCINYSVTCLTEPEMFPFETGTINTDALDKIVRQQSHALTPEFLDALAQALERDGNGGDSVASVTYGLFAPILQKTLSEMFLLAPASVMSDFYGNFNLLVVLSRIKPIAKVFCTLPGFLLTTAAGPAGGIAGAASMLTGRRLQDATALGLCLRLSTENDPNIQQMFANITKRTKPDVDGSMNTLRNKVVTVQELATELVKNLLKANAFCREQVLQWLEQSMQFNAERAKENPNANITSTCGTVLNLCMVLLRLCGPFMAPEAKDKALLIKPEFLMSMNAIFPGDVTKLTGSSDNSASSNSSTPKDFNFITRCFFLTARAIHLGPVAVIRHYMRLLRQLQFFQGRLNEQGADADPRLRSHFDMLATEKILLDVRLLQCDFVHELVRFVLLSCMVINSMVIDPAKDLDKSTSTLNLPLSGSKLPDAIVARIPEHLVEDICSILIFIARLEPKALNCFDFTNLLQMLMIFLSSPSYVRSPHLRAKMSEVLFFLFLPEEETEERHTAGTISGVDLLTNSVLAQNHLAPCLLALYGDVEQTGFYEKLEHRYNIACLLKYLWKLPSHQAAFVKIAQDKQNFIKFAHGLMNHINGLVTDALTNLPEIKILQEEMQNTPVWMSYDDATREQKQSLLTEKERIVTSSLQLANETIHMLSYLTSAKEMQETFLLPELEERLVSMLNSVLMKLAGKRGIDLKVANPENYKFRPKEMLSEIVQTLLHFADFESFQKATATNGFYEHQVFTKTVSILTRTRLLQPDQIEQFEQFALTVQRLHDENATMEEDLPDIPEEFLDPFLFTLMKDPVVLPSGYNIDRASINQHLLNDPSDPFTRKPLSVNDLVPNTQLKAKIDAWVAANRKT